MARTREFTRDDLRPVHDLYEELHRPPTRWERFIAARRSLQIVPAGRKSGVGITVSVGEEGTYVIASPEGHAPGEEVAPLLAERGLATPAGWDLMVDIGTAVGWVAPPGSGPDEVIGHALAAIETLGGAPEDGAWKAKYHARTRERSGWGRR